MSTKKLRDCEERCRKQRSIARTLHGRLYAAPDGRLLISRGEADPELMLLALSEASQDCGLLGACADGELSPALLDTLGIALARWRRAIQPRRGRKSESFRRERQEIEHLQLRLNACYASRKELAERGAIASPFLLDPEQAAALARVLAPYANHARILPEHLWQALIVMWLAGAKATERYLAALVIHLAESKHVDLSERVRKLREELQVFHARARTEHQSWLHVELAQRLATMPQELKKKKLNVRGTIPDMCDRWIGHLNAYLAGDYVLAMLRVPAAIAVLAALDKAESALPLALFRRCRAQDDLGTLQESLLVLLKESPKPGYERLLELLRVAPTLPRTCDFGLLRKLLHQGTTVDDLIWAQRRDLPDYLHGSGVRVGWFRRFEQSMQAIGLPLLTSELTALALDVRRPADAVFLDTWAKWLTRLSQSTLTPRVIQQLDRALYDLLLPALRRLRCHDRLHAWTRAASIGGKPENLDAWLQRIARYRRLAGQPSEPPHSVRKWLVQTETSERERAFLAAQVEAGRANDSQRARLEHLRGAREATAHDDRRAVRAAEEACVVAALDALRAELHRFAAQTWREHADEVPPARSLRRAMEYASWILRMDDDDRKLLREVLSTWRAHGERYKAHFTETAWWLKRARYAGVDVAAWLAPQRMPVIIDGRAVEIAFACDPREIFLMGTHFGTCLSLGAANGLSVLVNARDPNKQVVFAYGLNDAGQQILLARMLVAVTADWQLLRYQCYVVGDVNEERQAAFEVALCEYAARRARQADFTLADAGTAEKLGDFFWYDDGELEWPAAAREASAIVLHWVTNVEPPTWNKLLETTNIVL